MLLKLFSISSMAIALLYTDQRDAFVSVPFSLLRVRISERSDSKIARATKSSDFLLTLVSKETFSIDRPALSLLIPRNLCAF